MFGSWSNLICIELRVLKLRPAPRAIIPFPCAPLQLQRTSPDLMEVVNWARAPQSCGLSFRPPHSPQLAAPAVGRQSSTPIVHRLPAPYTGSSRGPPYLLALTAGQPRSGSITTETELSPPLVSPAFWKQPAPHHHMAATFPGEQPCTPYTLHPAPLLFALLQPPHFPSPSNQRKKQAKTLFLPPLIAKYISTAVIDYKQLFCMTERGTGCIHGIAGAGASTHLLCRASCCAVHCLHASSCHRSR